MLDNRVLGINLFSGTGLSLCPCRGLQPIIYIVWLHCLRGWVSASLIRLLRISALVYFIPHSLFSLYSGQSPSPHTFSNLLLLDVSSLLLRLLALLGNRRVAILPRNLLFLALLILPINLSSLYHTLHPSPPPHLISVKDF